MCFANDLILEASPWYGWLLVRRPRMVMMHMLFLRWLLQLLQLLCLGVPELWEWLMDVWLFVQIRASLEALRKSWNAWPLPRRQTCRRRFCSATGRRVCVPDARV